MRGPPLALAALISAYRQIDGSERLRATLPLVGGTLIEHQARQAVRAGAAHIVILVERLPAALTGAIDALRRDGIAVDIARSVGDAADRVHPDERLLVIADGCIVGQSALDRLVAVDAPALLTLKDEPGRAAFERIDAADRWAGLALLDGGRLRSTAAMLGDWDLESTLLRRTVQEGAARLNIFATEDGATPAGLPIIAESEAALGDLEKHLLSGSRRRASSWPERYLFAPVEEPAARLLIKRSIEPEWMALLACALAAMSAPLVTAGLEWAAFLLLLLSGPVRAVALRLAAVRLASIRRAKLFDLVRAVGGGLALLACSGMLAERGGWGWWIVAAAVILGMLALRTERSIALRAAAWPDPPWLASLDGLIWGFLPFALAGRWDAGVAALACYAILSFAVVQHSLLRHFSGKSASRGLASP